MLGWLTEGEAVWSMNVGADPLGSGLGVVNLAETQHTLLQQFQLIKSSIKSLNWQQKCEQM